MRTIVIRLSGLFGIAANAAIAFWIALMAIYLHTWFYPVVIALAFLWELAVDATIHWQALRHARPASFTFRLIYLLVFSAATAFCVGGVRLVAERIAAGGRDPSLPWIHFWIFLFACAAFSHLLSLILSPISHATKVA